MSGKISTRFSSVDSGKLRTKFAGLDTDAGKYSGVRMFFTRYSKGASFADRDFQPGTYIVQVDDGDIYMIGRDARIRAERETTKASEIHRICTMTSLAMSCSPQQVCEVIPSICIPVDIGKNPATRNSYAEYILGKPEQEHVVKMKLAPNADIITLRFVISGKQYIYPEGSGVQYEYPELFTIRNKKTAVIDIGNLNVNGTVYRGPNDQDKELGFTCELGGEIMISTISKRLSTKFGFRVSESDTARILNCPPEMRYLDTDMYDENETERIKRESAEIISGCMLEHANQIKQSCEGARWSLPIMQKVFEGGTTPFLENELRQVFGNRIFIPDNPATVSTVGNLRMTCRENGIDLEQYEHKTNNGV